MDELFEIIEKLPKENQLIVLLDLLEELGGSVQVRRNQLSQYWVPRMAEQLEKERLQCELIKIKIRELYRKNIKYEFHIQNIAQP